MLLLFFGRLGGNNAIRWHALDPPGMTWIKAPKGRLRFPAAMDEDLIGRYDERVPRYTSYPTAPHFSAEITGDVYRRWLRSLDPALPLSLYVHVPFCDTLCWFCGCHTKVVRRYDPVAAYLASLRREILLVAGALGGPREVRHLHFGGGSPTLLRSPDLVDLFAVLYQAFAFAEDAEIAVEIDPRGVDPALIDTLAAVGVNRASLGVQDLDPVVQAAVNRHQSLAQTKTVADRLRAAGISALNVDLMYGLPHQIVAGVRATVEAVIEALRPARLSVFGYAHVPWMKRHQRLIDEAALPGPLERFQQAAAAAEAAQKAGYVWIGLDHFARPDDPLAVAAATGALRRNFQGYTTDGAPVRLGFGPSAIGMLPQGYVQNVVGMPDYRRAVITGGLPVARGLELAGEDRLRGAVIERLMCDLAVDLEAVCRAHGRSSECLADAIGHLERHEDDGLITIDGGRIAVTSAGRPFLRSVCAAFDRYLRTGEARHARAV